MFFEGAEKKLEIIVSKEHQPLYEKPESFWKELVEQCEATILSSVRNEKQVAFLLSESSLFVWDDRLLMLTCGQTKLIKSAEFFIEAFGRDSVDCLFFQRKNEYRSHLQTSDFIQDAKILGNLMDGAALRLGKMHSHHTQLFHTTSAYEPIASDRTCELLMYDMAPEVISFLTREDLTKEEIRNFFQFERLLPNFELDDFVFQPYGYSLNGIRGEDYFTVHVTPQETSPYISFETNLRICEKSQVLLHQILEILRPFSFDVMTFNCSTEFDFGETYLKTIHVQDKLDIGYDVHFRYYNQKTDKPEKVYRYKELI
ncbi:MAG: adenosylmethionine decarboxylase [Bacteriovoracaceae bacterium]|nr:adenosylmethionine decarboxylase [Bacteriovoracaceae bacterium]